jgi:hypothetical protein
MTTETSPKDRLAQTTTPYMNTSYTEKCKSPQRLFGLAKNPAKPEGVTKSNNSSYFKKSPQSNSPGLKHMVVQSVNNKKLSPVSRDSAVNTSSNIKSQVHQAVPIGMFKNKWLSVK